MLHKYEETYPSGHSFQKPSIPLKHFCFIVTRKELRKFLFQVRILKIFKELALMYVFHHSPFQQALFQLSLLYLWGKKGWNSVLCLSIIRGHFLCLFMFICILDLLVLCCCSASTSRFNVCAHRCSSAYHCCNVWLFEHLPVILNQSGHTILDTLIWKAFLPTELCSQKVYFHTLFCKL